MGITPIGPLAMLPVTRLDGSAIEPAPMARVERSARTEDETYSPSKEGGDSQSQSRESRGEDGDSELSDAGEPVYGQDSMAEPSIGAAPLFDRPPVSPANISIFA